MDNKTFNERVKVAFGHRHLTDEQKIDRSRGSLTFATFQTGTAEPHFMVQN